MNPSYPLLGHDVFCPPGPDFLALCQAQIDLLTEQMKANKSAVYLTEPLSTNLIPIVVYPPVTPLERDTTRPRSLNPIGNQTECFPVKIEDLATLPTDSETIDPHRLILPLMYKEQMMGLLVTGRDRRRWESHELTRVEKIAHTLAIACLMDRRQQWYERQLQEERYQRSWEHERLDTFLHQVRNPLTALKTFGKLLLKRLLPDDVNAIAITGILRESDRLRDLIAEFESEIEADNPTVEIPLLSGQSSPTAFLLPSVTTELDTVNASDILDPLILSATAVANEKNIALTTDSAADLPSIRANTAGLREVLSNLLDNALKYTPSGGKVSVSVRSNSEGVEIEISDTGYGIAIEDQPNIFQRHYRGVQAEGEIPGTGLGLAIARELIEKMGGSIEFISPNPQATDSGYPGTVFWVRLPKSTPFQKTLF
jgi:signal transduction histidine kinase